MAISAQPIGITLPIKHGSSGYFNQSFDVISQVKSNLAMLLKTKKGERRMNPNFGSGLWEVLFEFNDENLNQLVESTVRRDVEKWLPYVNIKSLTVDNGTENKDKYAISISILFTVKTAGISGDQTLTLLMQQSSS